MSEITLTLEKVHDLTFRALTSSNTSKPNAESVTESVVDSEAEGIHSHGLARLPTYCEHARCGKIDGHAQPVLEKPGPAALKVDAKDGFAHPAIDLGFKSLLPLAKEMGIAALAVTNSYNCGIVGYHAGRIAGAGLLALCFVNAPASMAPWGGTKAVFGTNPITCGIPRRNGPPVIIDQASSVVAKSELIVHARNNEPIPEGWALDKNGNPTTDPKTGLDGGTMVPLAKHKGAGYAFLVEVLAAAVTGAHFAFQASSFADNQGGSPRTGQFFIAINPDMFLGGDFSERIEQLIERITSQKGALLHGADRLAARKRTAKNGVVISKTLYDRIEQYTSS